MIEEVAKEVRKIGVMYVKIGGGDPFLHPDFSDIISILRDAECFLTISTNSISMTKEIAQLLAEARVRTTVSIEGLKETNDSLRGDGHFNKALEAIDLLKEFGVETMFRTTLLRQNLGEISDLVALAICRRVKIKFSYCRPAGRAIQNQSVLNLQDTSDYLKALKCLNESEILPHVVIDEGMMFNQPNEISAKLLRGRMCGASNRSMHIDAHGKVSPCVFLGPTFAYGKLYKDGSIIDFWQGKVGNKFKIAREIRQPKECDGCSRLCKNECPANRFYFWGNFDMQDPNCLCYTLRRSQGSE
jgi:MoaA/NifB/PqqE/SkfB family radical SAM enzyme